jgi:hypothetical protein
LSELQDRNQANRVIGGSSHSGNPGTIRKANGGQGVRVALIRDQQLALSNAKDALDEQVTEKLKAERERIAVEEAKKARLALGNDLDQKTKEVAELSEIIKERDLKLADAQKVQAELMKKQRELDDETRELDLTIEKRVQGALETVHAKARLEAEDGFKHKVTEKEEQIASMQRQIEELKRKAEQGSLQLQGEAQEIELESLLRGRFPRDVIEPVPKGEFGGDVLHRVVGPPCAP